MNGKPTDRRWQLQEAEGRGKQWNLLDSEQDLDDRWQLQPDNEYTNEDGYNWQPIDALPEERGGGVNWVLPSLVLVAVLAVAGYVAVTGLDSIGLGGLNLGALFPGTQTGVAANPAADGSGEPEVTNDGQAALAATELPPTPTIVAPTPTETLLPPTATPLPVLEKRVAIVREQYGVNARSEPSTVGDPVEVIAQGTQLPIWDAQTNSEGDWFQISLANQSLAWISASFVDVTSSSVSYDEMNNVRQQYGQPLLPTPTSPAPVADAAAVSPGENNTQPVTDSVDANPTAAPISDATLSVSAAISSPLGLNVRTEANATATAITLLADSLTFPVVGRSEDGAWLQLQLPDGTLGWAAAQFLRVSGDAAQLPVGGVSSAPLVATPVATETEPITATTPITTSDALTTSDAIPTSTPLTTTATAPLTGTAALTGTSNLTTTTPTTATATAATASVTYLGGARLRQDAKEDSSDLSVLDFATEVKVIGATADGAFLKVELADGTQGWVTPNTVELNVPIESLPVVQ